MGLRRAAPGSSDERQGQPNNTADDTTLDFRVYWRSSKKQDRTLLFFRGSTKRVHTKELEATESEEWFPPLVLQMYEGSAARHSTLPALFKWRRDADYLYRKLLWEYVETKSQLVSIPFDRCARLLPEWILTMKGYHIVICSTYNW